MEVKDGKAVLSFDFAELGLTSFYESLEGIEVTGSDKVFFKANAIINKKNILFVLVM